MNNGISIISPVYNRLDLLKETAQFVMKLKLSNWEWILVDDGSEESTIEYLGELSKNDSRIKYLKRDSEIKGAPICRNIGAKNSKYEFLLFLDSDDLLGSTAIESRLDVIRENSNFDFYVFPVGLFSKEPHDLLQFQNLKDDRDDFDRFCYGENVWQTLGVVWRKSFFESIGGFNIKLPSFQDWELSMRSLMQTSKYYYQSVKVPDAFYRIDAVGSISNSRYNEMNTIANAEMILNIYNQMKSFSCMTEVRRINLLNFYISRISFWTYIPTRKNRKTQILLYLNYAKKSGLLLDNEFDFCKLNLSLYVSKFYGFFKNYRDRLLANQKKDIKYKELIVRVDFIKFEYKLPIN